MIRLRYIGQRRALGLPSRFITSDVLTEAGEWNLETIGFFLECLGSDGKCLILNKDHYFIVKKLNDESYELIINKENRIW
jgi:hypothetical protein